MLYQVYSACAEAQTFQKDKLLFSWAHRLISQKFHWSTSFFYVKCEIILWGFVYWKLCNSIFRVFFLFINVETWILTLAETSEAWNSLDVVSYLRHPVWVFFLGFFFYLLTESSILSWGNFVRLATLGKVNVYLLVDTGSHCDLLESQSLKNYFITVR